MIDGSDADILSQVSSNVRGLILVWAHLTDDVDGIIVP